MSIRKHTRRLTAGPLKFMAILGLALAACSGRASTNNLLVNGDFASGLSGWGTWTSGGWVNVEVPGKLNPASGNYWLAGAGTNADGTGLLYDGTPQLSCGQSGWGSGSYAYQSIAAAENVQYTLTVQGGAENWWLPTGEIRLIFQNATGVELGRSVVATTDSIHNGSNGGQGDKYDVGVPYQNWTNVYTAPLGTKILKVELCNPYGAGSTWFDNAYLTAPIDPPVIANLNPDGTRLLNTNVFSFTATSAAPINASGVQMTLNGADVSASLVVTGSGTTNISVSYSGLQSNRLYAAVINVTDTVNLSSFKNVSFDTYAPLFLWEAEDYDYTDNGVPGQFINNPVLSSVPAAGSYFGVMGTEGVDFHDRVGNGDHVYRSSDTMATAVVGDIPRQNFVAAGVADYGVGWFDGAEFPSGNNVGISSYQQQEWVNYTRTFPAGTYNLYGRVASGNGWVANVPVARVTGGQGTADQTTSELGTFSFPANGWGAFAYVPLTDRFGNRVRVSLANNQTLKVLAGSGANLNFFMLLPPDTEQPTITDVYPDGRTLLQGTNKFTFTVSSASHTIPQANVVLTLNGVTNTALTFTGSAASWNVSAPLVENFTNYTAVITVTDSVGNRHSTRVSFDTFNPASYAFEAEDWDFNGGQFIDNPVITSVPQADSYFEQVGTAADAFQGDVPPPTTAPFRYRSVDTLATDVCSDTRTRAMVAAQLTNALAFNYNLAYWTSNAWANYTHVYPSGNFNLYARLAGESGATNLVQLDKVGASTTSLGVFRFVGRGYNSFDWVPLVDANSGQALTIPMAGLATLRATTFGGVNPNSYLLVPATLAAIPLHAEYSGGVLTLSWSNPAFHLQAQTNAPGAGLSSNWGNYPGGAASPVVIPVNPSAGSVFFRLSN